MNKYNLEMEEILGYLDTYGVEGLDDSKIETLERIVLDCNKSMNNLEAVQVADSIYDTLYSALKQVKPSSGVFSHIWEEDGSITDYTELLVKNPMMSIETAKSYTCDELQKFIARVPYKTSYFASYKINGHGIRIVYENGYLVSATSRARSSAGRDLTRHLRILLGDFNESLVDYGLVELRGEIALPLSRLDEARDFNPSIKSAFSAVASLIKPSASDDEIRLLSFLCYGFIVDGFAFDTKEEEYIAIRDAGYETPEFLLLEEVYQEDLLGTLKDVIECFEENYEEFGYFCDGVVFEVNGRDEFIALGTEKKHNLGNIALKLGVWEQSQYCGIVNKIIWTKGKNKLSPVAIVSDELNDLVEDEEGRLVNLSEIGVLTAQGNRVKRVPLYEPKNIMILDAYVGEPLYFRYGGEAGVVPCFPDGRLLSEDVVKEVLTGDSGWNNWDNF